jgi:hypothetical protein
VRYVLALAQGTGADNSSQTGPIDTGEVKASAYVLEMQLGFAL